MTFVYLKLYLYYWTLILWGIFLVKITQTHQHKTIMWKARHFQILNQCSQPVWLVSLQTVSSFGPLSHLFEPLFPVSTSHMFCGSKGSNKHNFDRKQRRQECLKKLKLSSRTSFFLPFLSRESSHNPFELSGDPDTKGTWHQSGESKYLILSGALTFWLLFVNEYFKIANAGTFMSVTDQSSYSTVMMSRLTLHYGLISY